MKLHIYVIIIGIFPFVAKGCPGGSKKKEDKTTIPTPIDALAPDCPMCVQCQNPTDPQEICPMNPCRLPNDPCFAFVDFVPPSPGPGVNLPGKPCLGPQCPKVAPPSPGCPKCAQCKSIGDPPNICPMSPCRLPNDPCFAFKPQPSQPFGPPPSIPCPGPQCPNGAPPSPGCPMCAQCKKPTDPQQICPMTPCKLPDNPCFAFKPQPSPGTPCQGPQCPQVTCPHPCNLCGPGTDNASINL